MVIFKFLIIFFEFQESIVREFNIFLYLQCIRYGFFFKELMLFQVGMEKELVFLQYGDRIIIEILKGRVEGGLFIVVYLVYTVK